jgi:excisionase family DNA binding protein
VLRRNQREIVARNEIGAELSQMEGKHTLMGIRKSAAYLGIAVSTLYQWVSQKRIPYYKSGRLVMFDLKDLDQFIEKSKVNAVKEIYEYLSIRAKEVSFGL